MINQIRSINKNAVLFRDSKTGVAFIRDGSTGCSYSVHPNISSTGSVLGMKRNGYWDKDDKVVKCNGYSFNISKFAFDKDNEYEKIVLNECNCELCISRRKSITKARGIATLRQVLEMCGDESYKIGYFEEVETKGYMIFSYEELIDNNDKIDIDETMVVRIYPWISADDDHDFMGMTLLIV